MPMGGTEKAGYQAPMGTSFSRAYNEIYAARGPLSIAELKVVQSRSRLAKVKSLYFAVFHTF